MGRLTKRQVKAIARIVSATRMATLDSCAFEESPVSEEDADSILEEVRRLSSVMLKGDPANLGSTERVVDYVLKNY